MEIRPARQPDEGVSIQKTKAGAAIYRTFSVLKNMNGVIERIERVVEEMGMPRPPPAPPPAGDIYHCIPTSREQGRL